MSAENEKRYIVIVSSDPKTRELWRVTLSINLNRSEQFPILTFSSIREAKNNLHLPYLLLYSPAFYDNLDAELKAMPKTMKVIVLGQDEDHEQITIENKKIWFDTSRHLPSLLACIYKHAPRIAAVVRKAADIEQDPYAHLRTHLQRPLQRSRLEILPTTDEPQSLPNSPLLYTIGNKVVS